MPRFRLAQEMLPPRTAYQLVHDELPLDAPSRLNMATFVRTWIRRHRRSAAIGRSGWALGAIFGLVHGAFSATALVNILPCTARSSAASWRSPVDSKNGVEANSG